MHKVEGLFTRDASGLDNETTMSPSQIYIRGKRSLEHPVRKIKYKSRLPVVLEDAATISRAKLNSTRNVNKTELDYHFAQRFSQSHPSMTTSQMITAGPLKQYLGLDGNPFNMTQFKEMLKKQALIRHVSHGAEMAYLCLVGLIVAMLWTIWYLGGFARCHYQPKHHVYFSEEDNYLSVREVLEKKRQYLPMFKGKPEWEDVLTCNHRTNP
ncbi:uncharacterized protein LOC112561039 isoform X2 [Pomacea canaliculata]|uniref:uncharacterized protein LOC112561039 isoform X2 n=1 Tax=Pomacea canaliculata TaxID=400727 RepID=UPI000D726806|nr:uncharacterized protein LOC112561039 isoform X2 [Pomacea canaliculata]